MHAEANRSLNRLRHWQGQALRSRDLNHQMDYDALLRAWHNRALHEAFGVVEGLEVTLDLAGGRVLVGPGLAYAADGRALWAPRPLRLDLPTGWQQPGFLPESGLLLALSMNEAAGDTAPGRSGGDLQGACLPDEDPRIAGFQAGLAWASPAHFDPAHAAPLARLVPGQDGKPQLDPESGRVRVQARPLARPRLGSGATASAASWRLWEREAREAPEPEPQEPVPALSGVLVAAGLEGEEGVDSAVAARAAAARAARRLQVSAESRRSQVLGLQIDVDTSAAGFTAPPYYMAWLEGDLWDPELIGRFADGALDERDRTGRTGTGVLDWQRALLRLAEGLFQVELLQLRFGHIYRPTPTGFTYRVWFPHLAKWNGSRAPFDFLLLMAHRSRFSVAWLGVAESSRTGS